MLRIGMMLMASGIPIVVSLVEPASTKSTQILQQLWHSELQSSVLARRARATFDCEWSRYVVRSYARLDGATAHEHLVVQISRQEPAVFQTIRAISMQNLSTQQREIALAIALGRSNLEISKLLSISVNTVAYHLKQLYLKLGVHDRVAVIERLNEVRSGQTASTAIALGPNNPPAPVENDVEFA